MDDLISRAAAIEALGHFNDYVNGDPHFLNGIETAKEITENLPAVDAVPVVRCRDCKHWCRCDDGISGTCGELGGLWDENEFCSEGERRDSE